MKRYFVFIVVLVIAASVAFVGCEKKQQAPQPAAQQPVVTPPPAPPAAPPAPAPVPEKPAKK